MLISRNIVKYLFATHYETLRVHQGASQQQIKNNFAQLAKEHHPDIKQLSNDQFIKIKQAYDILRDPELRTRYDYELIHGYQKDKRRQRYYYEEQTYTKREQHNSLYSVLSKVGILLIGFYLAKLYLVPMTQHEIRRQNIILANQNIDSSPSVQQKRRKMFLKQMQEKKISSKVINIKTSNRAKESTKAKNSRKNSIQAIPGVKKEQKQQQFVGTEEYI